MKRLRSVDCASGTPDLRVRYALFGELFGTLCVYGPLFVRGRTKNAVESLEKTTLRPVVAGGCVVLDLFS